MITAGVTIVRDGDGLNAGIYRFLLKEKNLTGIDIVTPNNLRALAQRAFEAGKPLPISISIGTHMYEFMAAGYRAPMGVDEINIAGGLRGAPVPLSMCETIDVPVHRRCRDRARGGNPADRLDLARRPVRRIHAAHGRAALEPARARESDFASPQSDLLRAAHAVGSDLAHDTHALVAAARRDAGGGRAGQGHERDARRRGIVARRHLDQETGRRRQERADGGAVGRRHQARGVVDDDIDVYNGLDVEWAIATRVQAGPRCLRDPRCAREAARSEPARDAGRCGAHRRQGRHRRDHPEGIPRERYERIAYAYADVAKYGSYKLDSKAVAAGQRKPADAEIADLAQKILALIEVKPLYYAEVLEAFPAAPQQAITRAFGKLHVDEKLWQDPEGRMCVRGSKFAAVLPVRRSP
jgi:2,5-furandicarboxylate decarboxylase 1